MTLDNPPNDHISSLKFSPTDPFLLASSSWDKLVQVYHIKSNTITQSFTLSSALLDVCFAQDGLSLFTGGLDKTVSLLDLQTGSIVALGKHDDGVKSIVTSANLLFSGSWDKTIKVWDPRSEDALVDTLFQSDKVYTMDICDNNLVVGLANRMVEVYDIRNLNRPYQSRESSLKHMTRQIKCIPNGTGFATGSIEGRVAVDYFDASMQAQKFSFKCHRQKSNDVEMIYPVNALAYHPFQKTTLASGGGDGFVNIWDGSQKKRIRQFPQFSTSISSLDFNCTGTYLAIGVSYTFEEGEKEYYFLTSHPPDAIHLKAIVDADVTPRSKTR